MKNIINYFKKLKEIFDKVFFDKETKIILYSGSIILSMLLIYRISMIILYILGIIFMYNFLLYFIMGFMCWLITLYIMFKMMMFLYNEILG
jgi:hypothetical protein